MDLKGTFAMRHHWHMRSSDDQRKQIVDTMNQLAEEKRKAAGSGIADAGIAAGHHTRRRQLIDSTKQAGGIEEIKK